MCKFFFLKKASINDWEVVSELMQDKKKVIAIANQTEGEKSWDWGI